MAVGVNFWFNCGSHSLVPVLGFLQAQQRSIQNSIMCKLALILELETQLDYYCGSPLLSMARVLQGMYPLRALQKKIAEEKCKA